MKVYAAYGSNMNLKQMSRRCPKAKVIGTGTLNNYKLTFRGGGHANIKTSKGSKVPVVLWEVTHKCEKALDIYEGYPRYYIKKEVIVNTEAGEVKAMVYIMDSDYADIVAEPTPAYYDIIYKGYIDNNISVETLKQAFKV